MDDQTKHSSPREQNKWMKERLGWMDGLGMDGHIHSDLVTVSG